MIKIVDNHKSGDYLRLGITNNIHHYYNVYCMNKYESYTNYMSINSEIIIRHEGIVLKHNKPIKHPKYKTITHER